jgi:putative DNA primase/helicase
MSARRPEIVDPIDKLRYVVEAAEKSNETPSEANIKKAKDALGHYLRTCACSEAVEVVAHADYMFLIGRLKQISREWAQGANVLLMAQADAVNKAKKARPNLRLVDKDTQAEQREIGVWNRLERTGGQHPKATATLINYARIFELDTRWRDRIRLNEFSGDVEIDDEPIHDDSPTSAAVWMAETYGINAASRTVHEAMRHVGRANSYHPVREYLRTLKWDRKTRLPSLLSGYMQARAIHEGHRDLLQLIGQRWMISAVARVMDPGCQVKSALLLLGDQNAGKSKALEILGGHWYSRSRLDLRSKDGMAQVQGVWIYEIPEVKQMFDSRTAEEIKAFIDQPDDRYRAHFGRVVTSHPRQMVFAATDNNERLLNDPTGAARYWPVSVGSIDLAALAADRDQLWAEAVIRYDGGERWHFDSAESRCLAEIATEHSQEDPWTAKVHEWMSDGTRRGQPFEIGEILSGIQLDLRAQDAPSAHRVGAILRALGCLNTRENRGTRKVHVWRMPL